MSNVYPYAFNLGVGGAMPCGPMSCRGDGSPLKTRQVSNPSVGR